MSDTTPAPRRKRPQGQHVTAKTREALQARFLEAYEECGMVKQAAEAAGVSRMTVYRWTQDDEAFAARYKEAEQVANGIIRDELWRRGVPGWLETTITVETDPDGNTRRKTVTVHRYSDACIRLVAQSRMPEFKERLDVTSGNETLGAYHFIAEAAADPESAAKASQALDLLAAIPWERGYNDQGP